MERAGAILPWLTLHDISRRAPAPGPIRPPARHRSSPGAACAGRRPLSLTDRSAPGARQVAAVRARAASDRSDVRRARTAGTPVPRIIPWGRVMRTPARVLPAASTVPLPITLSGRGPTASWAPRPSPSFRDGRAGLRRRARRASITVPAPGDSAEGPIIRRGSPQAASPSGSRAGPCRHRRPRRNGDVGAAVAAAPGCRTRCRESRCEDAGVRMDGGGCRREDAGVRMDGGGCRCEDAGVRMPV